MLKAAEFLESGSTLETFPDGLHKVDGLWRLVYSSALSAGSGSGGGASSQSLPFFQTPDTGSFSSFGPGSQIGQVYARISTRKQKLENIVEVFLRAPLPFIPQLGKVVLNLEHKLEVSTEVCACTEILYSMLDEQGDHNWWERGWVMVIITRLNTLFPGSMNAREFDHPDV